MRRLRLTGAPFEQSPQPTSELLRIPCDLLITSIGFRVASLPGLDLPCRPGLPNAQGRVLDAHGRPTPGLYVAGWAKRGPSGVLGTNRACAQETVQSMMADRSSWPVTRPESLAALLDRLFAQKPRPVVWEDWLYLDNLEKQAGNTHGRRRVKFDDRENLRAALRQRSAQT